MRPRSASGKKPTQMFNKRSGGHHYSHTRCGALSLEFVREPAWTLHFCAGTGSDVIRCVSLFTARPLRAVAEWLTGLAADWTVASPPFEKGRSHVTTAVHPAHRTRRRQPRDVCGIPAHGRFHGPDRR